MKTRFLLTIATALVATSAVFAQERTLLQDFQEPTKSARPRVWWHWMNGNITKDGISKDLHWMNEAGVVGFHNFDANLATPQIVDHRLAYMTEEWKDAFKFALSVADSLDMEVTIASSPGWSETGGPWVKDENAMKKIVWREVDVEGQTITTGKGSRKKSFQASQTISIPKGFSCQGSFQDDPSHYWETDLQKSFYRDIAILAVKLSDSDVNFRKLSPRVTASTDAIRLVESKSGEVCPASDLFDALNSDSIAGGVKLKTDKNGSAWIQYEFDEPQTVKAVVITDLKDKGDIYAIDRELQSSEDGVHFHKVAGLGYQSTAQKTYSVPATKAKYFRLQLKDKQKQSDCGINLRQFILSSVTRIQDAGDKSGLGFYRLLSLETTIPDSDVAKVEDVQDLTSLFTDGKSIEWAVPEGRWRIFRFGYSLTGKTNHPASPEATGLEVDKLDPDAVRAYLNDYLKTYQDASGGKLGPDGISHMLTDSYEAGPQTWTENLPAEFKTRKGYDLLPWLPALTGMVMGSTAQTERFLFDWRRCIGDMIAEYHYDIQNEVLAQYGMKRYTESHENYRANLSDGMDCKRYAEVPMSAFWMTYNQGTIFTTRFEADIRESASVAHIYGQNIAAAESFTSDGIRDGAWVFSPAVLKPTADAALACGLNRFVIHCSPHQPVDDKAPGLGLGKYGQWFDRHQTWAKEARAWTDYLSRSCEMLQKGKFVADVAVYYGEDNNLTGIHLKNTPDVPDGYSYDYFSPSVLLDVARPENGRIVTPSGMSYRVLYLDSNTRIMSLAVLRRIKEYVDAGVPVCGTVPSTLADNSSEEEFKALVQDIWFSGRSNVQPEINAAVQLDSLGVAPDFRSNGSMKGIKFVHRSIGGCENGGCGTEIYWVSNQTNMVRSFEASFRASGKRPEIWRAETGSTERVSWRGEDGRTVIPLTLNPYESFFVVFEEATSETSESVPETSFVDFLQVASPWRVTFQDGRGGPEGAIEMVASDAGSLASLSTCDDPRVRYYSGEVTYSNSFKLKGKDLKGGRFVLDLGEVKDLAEVRVNGVLVGTLWHGPFVVDVTGALRKGSNSLEIKVVNTWRNRIIGDMQDWPEGSGYQKVSWYSMDLLKADTPLLPSGLLGPVKLQVAE